MIVRPLLVAILVSFAGASLAQQTKLLGFDDMSCAAWSRADTDQRAAYVTWARGFLSGHNYARPAQQISAISAGSVEYQINRHCSENRASDIVTATMRLADRFSGRNAPITK